MVQRHVHMVVAKRPKIQLLQAIQSLVGTEEDACTLEIRQHLTADKIRQSWLISFASTDRVEADRPGGGEFPREIRRDDLGCAIAVG